MAGENVLFLPVKDFCRQRGKFRILIESGNVGAAAEASLSVAISTGFQKDSLTSSVSVAVQATLQTVDRN